MPLDIQMPAPEGTDYLSSINMQEYSDLVEEMAHLQQEISRNRPNRIMFRLVRSPRVRRYSSLNDAKQTYHGLDVGSTAIFFMKHSWFDRGIGGEEPVASRIYHTHVKVGEVSSRNLFAIRAALLSARWNPRDEAVRFLENLGVHHTSIIRGDVIVLPGRSIGEASKAYLVKNNGFKLLPDVPPDVVGQVDTRPDYLD